MKVAIIGGGMAGLGAAYELVKNGNNVVLYEKSATLGGLASVSYINGVSLENFYYHLFPTYEDFLEVAKDLNISDKIFFKKAKTGNFCGGKLYPFTSPFDLLSFSPVSFLDRIRMGFFSLYLKLKKDWSSFENKKAGEWILSHFGRTSYEKIWKPLLKSKFAGDADKIGMVWVWAKIFERPSKFGYFDGGFKTFISLVEKYLKENGTEIKCGVEVKNPAQLLAEGFDSVVIAAPDRKSTEAAKLKYVGVVCARLILKKHLTKYYWINVLDENMPFVCVVEQTNFVDENTYGGLHPVYVSRYVNSEDNFYKLPDEEIKKDFIKNLKKINKEFSEDWITECKIFRSPCAQHVAFSGYKKIRPSFKTDTENIWWVSMSHTYPWDRGTNHSFRLGRDLARELLK
jgi:protoporphyrinogen oxidase